MPWLKTDFKTYSTRYSSFKQLQLGFSIGVCLGVKLTQGFNTLTWWASSELELQLSIFSPFLSAGSMHVLVTCMVPCLSRISHATHEETTCVKEWDSVVTKIIFMLFLPIATSFIKHQMRYFFVDASFHKRENMLWCSSRTFLAVKDSSQELQNVNIVAK